MHCCYGDLSCTGIRVLRHGLRLKRQIHPELKANKDIDQFYLELVNDSSKVKTVGIRFRTVDGNSISFIFLWALSKSVISNRPLPKCLYLLFSKRGLQVINLSNENEFQLIPTQVKLLSKRKVVHQDSL